MFNLIRRRRLSDLGVSLRNPQIFSLSFSFSSSSNPTSLPKISGIGSSVTADYLMKSCGFPREKALSVSNYMSVKPDRADSVLAFLKNYGFTQTQILSAVKRQPKILYFDPEKIILPKLEFLSSVGLSSPDIARVITSSPTILSASLENKIIPCYNFFRNFLQSDKKTTGMIKRNPTLFPYYNHAHVLQNLQFLQELGVPRSNMIHFINENPRGLLVPPDKLRRLVEEVKKMGFDPLRGNFMWAVLILGSMSKSSWEKKVESYKKWGLSEEEIIVAFGKNPWFMRVSEEKLERVMDFVINKMGMKSSVLVQCPSLVTYSFEKRIAPRLLFYKVLVDRGLIKKGKDNKFNSWLMYAEEDFITRIRENYKAEAPQLLKLYQSKLDAAA